MCSWKWAADLFCKEKQQKGGGFWFFGCFWFGFGVGVFLGGVVLFLKLQEDKLNVIRTSTVMYWKLFSSY